MIKIAVISLGKNFYAAFSLNQEYPLATIVRAKGYEHRRDIEDTILVRFHSQRNEYKKLGYNIPRIERNGKQRGGWKFIWNTLDVFWNKVEPQEKPQVVVNEPGLTIVRENPYLADVAKKTVEEFTADEQYYIAEKIIDGGFRFLPVTDDIVKESDIPAYMREHKA